MPIEPVSIESLGDTLLLVRASDSTPGWAARARESLLQHDGRAAVTEETPHGVLDLVAAFGTLGVHYDPHQVASDRLAEWVRSVLAAGTTEATARPEAVVIPICYGGKRGPDLDRVATGAGLSADEVVTLHSAAAYRVGAIGFQPGFPYLSGLPDALHTPRLASPRTRVEAGSVGIGGVFTGVYPNGSPGGWNLIGRTPTKLFDPGRERASLLAVGDRVRFQPIGERELERQLREAKPPPPVVEESRGEPLLRVTQPGLPVTLRSAPQYGQQHIGVGPSGAADTVSHALANGLVGNSASFTTIEATLAGPVLEALVEVRLGVAGALPGGVNGPRIVALRPGERLDLRSLSGGCRCYVAISGGFLRLEDRLLFATPPRSTFGRDNWSINHAPIPEADGDCRSLRVLAGPHSGAFSPNTLRRFYSQAFAIANRSDRTGLRCEGPPIVASDAADLESLPVATGAIQIPPDGQPIVLGPDRFTLGGYPLIAAVISADWPLIGQLRPGDRARFCQVSVAEAHVARQQTAATLQGLRAAIDLRRR